MWGVDEHEDAGFAERDGEDCTLDGWTLTEEEGVAATRQTVRNVGGGVSVPAGGGQSANGADQKAKRCCFVVPPVAGPCDDGSAPPIGPGCTTTVKLSLTWPSLELPLKDPLLWARPRLNPPAGSDGSVDDLDDGCCVLFWKADETQLVGAGEGHAGVAGGGAAQGCEVAWWLAV